MSYANTVIRIANTVITVIHFMGFGGLLENRTIPEDLHCAGVNSPECHIECKSRCRETAPFK